MRWRHDLLKGTPTQKHLSRLYYELAQIGARAIGEKEDWPYSYKTSEELICLAADMSRYDPRLFDIMVELFYFHWQKINPCVLRQFLPRMVTPQTLFTIFNFITFEKTAPEKQAYYEYLTKGYSKVSPQLYFINLYLPGSLNMQKASRESIQEFLDWGFLSRERPIIHENGKRISLGHWGPSARKNIRRQILKKKESFHLSDYLERLEHTISRQQALIDLKNDPKLTCQGHGRGSVWILVDNKS